MGSTKLLGRDGNVYDSWEEKRKADTKWEQQEKQNRLLQEQNKLIKHQQDKEKVMQDRERKQLKETERIKRQNEKRHLKENEFLKICEESIYPMMKNAGIKEPIEYHNKLRELYNERPRIIFKEYIKEKPLLEIRPNTMSKKIVPIFWTSIAFIFINLIICAFNKDIAEGLLYFSFILLIPIIPYSIYNSFENKNRLARLQNEEIQKENKEIQSQNERIDKDNERRKEKLNLWEDKIKRFEDRRIDKFNYELEIAISQLSEQENLLLGNDKCINYELQFNQYPCDFDEKKEKYLKEMQIKKAEDNGTEIFEDL